jgi:HSP20 family protein
LAADESENAGLRGVPSPRGSSAERRTLNYRAAHARRQRADKEEDDMLTKKTTRLAPAASADSLARLRQATAEIDRMFHQEYRWPALTQRVLAKTASWYPAIDVFDEDNCLVANVDLPGMKKEEVKVEVVDGQLTIAGERKVGTDEKKHRFYRCERGYGSFYRTIPLPSGVAIDSVTATFADGVLNLRVPLPPPEAASKPRAVKVEGPAAAGKAVA